jgi:hypothetical protein
LRPAFGGAQMYYIVKRKHIRLSFGGLARWKYKRFSQWT